MSHTNEQFLLTAIEVSGCKLDFKALGDALGIKQSAAYMRFSRLKAKVGAANNGKDDAAPTTPAKKGKTATGSAKGTSGKKRKLDLSEHGDDDETAGGREDTPVKGGGEAAVKREPDNDDDFM